MAQSEWLFLNDCWLKNDFQEIKENEQVNLKDLALIFLIEILSRLRASLLCHLKQNMFCFIIMVYTVIVKYVWL